MNELIKSLQFTPSQIELRRSCIGGSDANIIMSGIADRIVRLWREKTGKEQPEDLSGNLGVIMGQFTEPLNAAWYELSTNDLISERNVRFVSKTVPYMAANIDGLCGGGKKVWEAKHVNAFSNVDDVVRRYQPQLYHNGFVCESESAVLSVFKGTMDWFHVEVGFNPDYLDALLEAEEKFWLAVKQDIPPFDIPSYIEPPQWDSMRTISMEGSNEWAAFASDFLGNKEQAKKFEDAKKNLRSLVANDVKRATGYGVCVYRAKNNILYVVEQKNEKG